MDSAASISVRAAAASNGVIALAMPVAYQSAGGGVTSQLYFALFQ